MISLQQYHNSLSSSQFRITSGCLKLDELLLGGFPSGLITELFGASSTGKSQFLHTLCVTCQLRRSKGGGAGKCIFIDTEGTFRPERLIPICERFNVSSDIVLDNIVYARAYNIDHQLSLLESTISLLKDDTISLLVIDSISALYRSCLADGTNIVERQRHLGLLLKRLTEIATQSNIAVVYSNQILSSITTSSIEDTERVVHFGGHVLAHASNLRLFLSRSSSGQRQVSVFQASFCPETTVPFQLNEAGIMDT
ncbi:hypothetical protein P9112_011511 [Eukaryota sp. TZLM1-RC]